MPRITTDLAVELEEGDKKEGKQKPKKKHEKEGYNNGFRNITAEYNQDGKRNPIDLSGLDKTKTYIWALAVNKDGEFELRIGYEHPELELEPAVKARADAMFGEPKTVEREVAPDIWEVAPIEEVPAQLLPAAKPSSSPAIEISIAGKETDKPTKQSTMSTMASTKSEKTAMMGHATLTHKAPIAGELSFIDGKWVVKCSNKSGRFGDGNEAARKRAGVKKIDLLEFSAKLFSQQTNLDIDHLELWHKKTWTWRKINKAYESKPLKGFYQNHPTAPKPLWDRRTRHPNPLHENIREAVRDVPSMTTEDLEKKYGKDNVTPLKPAEVSDPRKDIGDFAGVNKDRNLIFKKPVNRAHPAPAFHYVLDDDVPSHVVSETSQAATSPPSDEDRSNLILLELGKLPSREFRNAIRQHGIDNGLDIPATTARLKKRK